MLNESTATALSYGYFRKDELHETNVRFVTFVDIGHSKTTVTIAGFLKNRAQIFFHDSDRNLGGRDLNYQVMVELSKEFQREFQENPMKSVKCRLRMLESIEKARKILSGDD